MNLWDFQPIFSWGFEYNILHLRIALCVQPNSSSFRYFWGQFCDLLFTSINAAIHNNFDHESNLLQLFAAHLLKSGNTKIWAKTLINCVWKYTKDMHGYCTFSYHFPLNFMIELMCIFKVPGPIVIMGPAIVIFEKQITDLSSFCPF